MLEICQGAPDDISSRPENEAAVYRFLNQLNVPFIRIDHEAVHTMEDCEIIDRQLAG